MASTAERAAPHEKEGCDAAPCHGKCDLSVATHAVEHGVEAESFAGATACLDEHDEWLPRLHGLQNRINHRALRLAELLVHAVRLVCHPFALSGGFGPLLSDLARLG